MMFLCINWHIKAALFYSISSHVTFVTSQPYSLIIVLARRQRKETNQPLTALLLTSYQPPVSFSFFFLNNDPAK